MAGVLGISLWMGINLRMEMSLYVHGAGSGNYLRLGIGLVAGRGTWASHRLGIDIILGQGMGHRLGMNLGLSYHHLETPQTIELKILGLPSLICFGENPLGAVETEIH